MHKNQSKIFPVIAPSPWPFLLSLSLLVLAVGAVLYMRNIDSWVFYTGSSLSFFCLLGWLKDLIYELNGPYKNSINIQNSLKISFILFICSELMLFVAFFWGYFDAAINPLEVIGSTWPPKGITPPDPMHLPYLNTLILLLSSTTVTWAHQELLSGQFSKVTILLSITIFLGILFTCIQIYEYFHAPFTFKDGIYASNFYMATGFHGFHVILGTVFLVVCLFRNIKREFQVTDHVGFETANWYWHFVDVVWLFLFIAIYWGSYKPLAR